MNTFCTKKVMVSLRILENILIKNKYINFIGYVLLWALFNKLCS